MTISNHLPEAVQPEKINMDKPVIFMVGTDSGNNKKLIAQPKVFYFKYRPSVTIRGEINMRVVLGIDAAWTPTEPSGVALIAEQGNYWKCIAIRVVYCTGLRGLG
jgi:hypothetical protein